MDFLQSNIVQQIEAYITDDNLKSDYNLSKYTQENDGWIPLKFLSFCNKFSIYNYDTILHALYSQRSNIIELSSFEPQCIRRRCQSLKEDSIQNDQTVIISGLPHEVKYEDLIEFFHRFYPVDEIKMFSSLNRFNGKAHVIFQKAQDASAFVQQSKSTPVVYVNDDLLQLCHGYTLICKMLDDCNEKNTKHLSKQNDQQSLMKGKSISTRLTNHSAHVSFNGNAPVANGNSVHYKSSSTSSQIKSCLKSNSCATEQILFCQNITNNKLIKPVEHQKQKLVSNKFSYEYYRPDQLLKQIRECVIISVLNPHCFTIQLKPDAVEFDKFQREINEFYNSATNKQFYITSEQIRLNLCVICSDSKSSENYRIWNRSQILDFDLTDNTVNLFYVDLGTWEEYVPINRLRHLTDYFHRHLVFSLTCRLAHIHPINNENDYLTWADDATNQFLAVIDQVIPDIELLSLHLNGCFETNLFLTNSGQDVCVNDYMIHIKKAKAIVPTTSIDDDNQNTFHLDRHDIDGNDSSIHPVVALYNRLGEVLQQSLADSRTASISGSSMSSPSILSRSFVKLIHFHIDEQETLPIVFVRYQKSILVPDFNICTLLKTIDFNINNNTIEQYALAIRYPWIRITHESNSDIFTQISSLIDIRYSDNIALYTLDFVGYILKHYRFQFDNVFLALENAKRAEMHASDLALWFTMDNELNTSSTPVSDGSVKLNQPNDHRFPILQTAQQSPIPIRLPFSNRLINM